jgi:hypothetical protein
MAVVRTDAVEFICCRRCGSADLRRSRCTGLWAAFMRLLDRRPYQCRSCKARSYWRREALPQILSY